jgi:hypothetical protein
MRYTVVYDAETRFGKDGSGDISDRGGIVAKVQGVESKKQGVSVRDVKALGRAGDSHRGDRFSAEDIEAQRQRNKVEMDARLVRIRERLQSPDCPMESTNPLLNASDDEIRAYIRKRRQEFNERHGITE